MSCIFCKTAAWKLISLTREGFDNVCQASIARGDDFHLTLTADKLNDYRIHDKCRCKYIKKRNIESCVKMSSHKVEDLVLGAGLAVVGSSSDPGTALAQPTPHYMDGDPLSAFEFSTCCIVCGKSITHIAGHLLGQIQSPSAAESLARAAQKNNRPDVEKRLMSVCDVNVNARYHRKCAYELMILGDHASLVSFEDFQSSPESRRHLSAMSVDEEETAMGRRFSVISVDDDEEHNCSGKGGPDGGGSFSGPNDADDDDMMDTNDDTVFDDDHPIGDEPAAGSTMGEACANCCRRLVFGLNMQLTRYGGDIIRRKFGRLPRVTEGVNFILCSECKTYLTTRLPDSQLWACAWPSVLASILSNKKYIEHRGALWKMLPKLHRNAWQLLGESSVLDPNEALQFEDYTTALTCFNHLVTSGKIGDFVKAMSEFPFPCVKCPAGCFAFVDECSPVPFNHLLDHNFGLSVFGGDKTQLNGARADWPSSSVQLGKFHVIPGLVIDTKLGLCVLICSKHGSGLKTSFVHVPRNPVLKDMGLQYPDTCAAAFLTPNVIRAGRMGVWTNSSHVVKAIGGYTGISSSSLAPNSHFNVVDRRLSCAESLAMRHRPDILEICRTRYSDRRDCNGAKELDRVLKDYDIRMKPNVDLEKAAAISGATFVDIHDSYVVNENMFKRDSTVAADDCIGTQLQSWKLTSCLVHPPTAGGCSPVSLQYDVKKQQITGALLHVLVHCPPVHELALQKFEQSKDELLLHLLQFAQYCAGKARNISKLKNAAECERKLNDEMPLNARAAGDICTKFILCINYLFPSALTLYLSADSAIDRVLSGATADVVFVFRSCQSRSERSRFATTLSGYHLAMVLGGDNLTDSVLFRWNDRFGFWRVGRNNRCQTSSVAADDKLTMPDWRITVYARSASIAEIDAQMTMNLGGQHRMKCAVHNAYLSKQPLSCEKPCCVRDCVRKARWSCIGRGEMCESAVCLAHGRDLIAGDAVVDIDFDLPGRILREMKPVVDDETADTGIASSELPDVDSDDDNDAGLDARVFAPIGIDGVDMSDQPPSHSRRDMIPVFDVNRVVPCHLVWNNHYSVMRRGTRFSDVRSNAIIDHIVSSSSCPSVSLLYPEGQLFPRIFWCEQSGSILGALPSFMMNTAVKNPFGIASVQNHNDVRIRDGDILTSHESPYWHFMFDVKLNTALNQAPSKLVFKRGLEFLQEGNPHRTCGEVNVDAHLPMDEAEATRRIKELASLLKKGKWTYFLTITANDQYTPGLRQITEAIAEAAKVEVIANVNERIRRELTDSYLPFLLRSWERFVRFFLEELIMRNDTIVGKVKNIFYRYEFQGAGSKGNKPHVHCGITLHDEPELTSAARISCQTESFHTSQYGVDFESLLNEGVVRDAGDYRLWCEVVSCVNRHDCKNCNFRCQKATSADGNKICRYHRQPPMPTNVDSRGWFQDIPMPYSEEVYAILAELGLACKQYDPIQKNDVWYVSEELKAGKWHYQARQDEFFLSTIPMVSAICRSSSNVDMCDRKFQVSYLVKYIAGKEEHQMVDVAGTKEVTEIKTVTSEHGHEKISGCRNIMTQKQKESGSMGREICLAEVVWFILDFPYTYCNAGFVHVSTLPLENRVGAMRQTKRLSKLLVANNVDDIAPVKGRKEADLPMCRQFSSDQLAHIQDYLQSPYWCDTTSSFNIRPPELLAFDQLQVYAECFVVVGTEKCHFETNIGLQPWYDGLCRRVLLRSCSLHKAIEFLSCKAESGDVGATELLKRVFLPVQASESGFCERFMQQTAEQQVVAVVSTVKPWDRTKFLCHLCLSLGVYRTELGLFLNSSIKTAFIKAGLLQERAMYNRRDVLPILRRYIIEDLRFHPISARQFDKYVKAALTSLIELLTDNAIGDYSPCVTDVMLKEQASDLVISREKIRKANIIQALQDDPVICPMLPNDLATATQCQPLHWTPFIGDVGGITAAAVAEQTAALECCIRAIDSILNPACCGLRFPCLVGRAGSGKSHVLKLAVAYAISKGLEVELMSVTSERARKLGGNHMHLVFPFGVNNSRLSFAHDIATSCLSQLDKDPLKAAILRRTDVFFFEEIGMLSAEYFSAIDNVLRTLTGNSSPLGRKLLLSTGDFKQLPPIQGRPLWSSLNMCALMDVFVFACDVRAANDVNLQRINSDCRRALTADECKSVADIIVKECRFEADWASVPDVAVRIVPTKKAEMAAMDEFLAKRMTTSYKAIDEVQNGSTWEMAGDRVSAQLNKNCYEYDVCKLYLNAVVRMTYNRRMDGNVIFSQGQVAVVVGLPDDSVGFTNQKLSLRLAPPGVRSVDAESINESWQEVEVAPRTTLPSVVGRGLQMGRRTQFPIRYYLASTIHRIQGDTVSLVATEMSQTKRAYRLWQREQFAVLVSRVHHCRDLIFVGSIPETRAAIEQIMSRSSKWDALIDHFICELDVARLSNGSRRLVLDQHPFMPMYRELPSIACGYAYLLVSLTSVEHRYIGEGLDLKRSLRLQNTGHGADETRNTALHPWGVYAFVYGFDAYVSLGSGTSREEFVTEWRAAVVLQDSVERAYEIGVELADRWMRRYGGPKLTTVKCGQTITFGSSLAV